MRAKRRLARFSWSISGAILLLTATWFGAFRSVPAGESGHNSAYGPGADPHKQLKIDLDKATEVALPGLSQDLRPAEFKTVDGKSGWVIKLPGDRPIATPAYWDRTLFVGGGYGSHEFYAINADTGAVVWQIQTSDDGPTAAVVDDGCVAFNTESCTVFVCDAKTGRVLWQEWLGDPLMSQPAISKGRLFMAHPSGQRGQSSRAGHRLLCADLKTGRHIWDQEITADVISSPVISPDQVFFTCFDGTSYCLNAIDGRVLWKKENSGTSAPLVVGSNLIVTMKVQERGKNYEGIKRIDAKLGVEKDKNLIAREEARYLEENKGGGVGLGDANTKALDSSVGFSSAPPTANLSVANKQVGVSTVVGAWAYQGSRAAQNGGRVMNAQGRFLNCVQSKDGKFAWRAEVKGAGINSDSQIFSPPALGASNIYLCSAQGHLVAVRQDNGETRFLYAMKQPMAFQPALAEGNIYVGTTNGLVICLRTGDRDADGWYAWGGNAQHNK